MCRLTYDTTFFKSRRSYLRKKIFICASTFTSGSAREVTDSTESSYVLVYYSYNKVTMMATVLVAMCEDERSER